MPRQGLPEVRALGGLLRNIVLNPMNNQELNQDGGQLAADLTLALSWTLAQDIYALPGGTYASIGTLEQSQFGSSMPYAFRNDTRWNGFRAWAPLLGFGWTEKKSGGVSLVVDPTAAVRETLPQVFGDVRELPVDNWVRRAGESLPVLDGGAYRKKVEARLDESAWRPTRDTEVSVSLSAALVRLEGEGVLGLEERSDAPHRSLLGRRHRELRQVSHVVWKEAEHA